MPSAAPQKRAAPSRSSVLQSMMNPASLLLCIVSPKFESTTRWPMKYLHTMVRVTDIEQSLRFYRDALGLLEVSRKDFPAGRFTLVFMAAPGDEEAQVE